jgi:hypothetical protein
MQNDSPSVSGSNPDLGTECHFFSGEIIWKNSSDPQYAQYNSNDCALVSVQGTFAFQLCFWLLHCRRWVVPIVLMSRRQLHKGTFFDLQQLQKMYIYEGFRLLISDWLLESHVICVKVT